MYCIQETIHRALAAYISEARLLCSRAHSGAQHKRVPYAVEPGNLRDTQGTVKNCPEFWGGLISQVHISMYEIDFGTEVHVAVLMCQVVPIIGSWSKDRFHSYIIVYLHSWVLHCNLKHLLEHKAVASECQHCINYNTWCLRVAKPFLFLRTRLVVNGNRL